MAGDTQTTPVYRVENPTIADVPDGLTSHDDLVGQWFSPDIDDALVYLQKSTQTFGRNTAHTVDGAQLVVAHVPTSQLESLHVSRHPIAATMDVEGSNYLVPRDGSVPTDVIPLDGIVDELRGKLGNYDKYQEAKRRVRAVLGAVAVES